MGYKYSFFDNQTIGSDDLNNLAKRFVTEGIADIFTDGVPYNISILNSIVSANATQGVVPETDTSLMVYVSSPNVIISKGSAFFADGTVIDVDTEGISLEFTPDVVNYVYLVSDNIANKCYAKCTLSPLSGNVLLLAVIEKDATVTDKRKYAKGKIPSAYSSVAGLVTKAELYWNSDEIKNYAPKEIPLASGIAKGLFMYMSKSLSKTKTFGFVTFNADGDATLYISGVLTGSAAGYHSSPTFSSNSLIIQNATDLGIVLNASAKVENEKIIITPTNAYIGGEGYVTADFYVF